MSKSWNSKLGWFNDNYILRVLKASFGPSSKGSPMITFEFEIVSPETVSLNSEEVTVAGAKLRHWAVTQTKNANGEVDAEKTAKGAERLETLYKAFGMDFATFNPENPDTSAFEGKEIWAFVESNEVVQRKSQTAEQKAANQLGDVATNPITGEKQQNYYPRVKEFIGLVPK